ncbi:hypothetical protein GOV06_03935 [Candidatus Woesearchaeota archaeon]|nr:hypothetical protein [Candidatus Woesearchaeota archaeon]
MTKLVYVAHPIGGNVKENINSVLRILREIHTSNLDVIPFAPYLAALQYLRDDVAEEKKLGMFVNRLFFEKKVMDEVWLAGPKISEGMKQEIKLSLANKIPVKCHNPDLQPVLKNIIENYRRLSA